MPIMMKGFVDPDAPRAAVPYEAPMPQIQVNASTQHDSMEMEQLLLEPDRPPSMPYRLHIFGSCYMNFFTQQGLDAHGSKCHMTHQDDPEIRTDEPSSKKIRAPLTIKKMLVLPPTEYPQPAKSYICPVCHTQVGRKALSILRRKEHQGTHIRKEHQADKPASFPFVPERDILPGQLGYYHYYCFSVFTMDFALQTHFRRAARPLQMGV